MSSLTHSIPQQVNGSSSLVEQDGGCRRICFLDMSSHTEMRLRNVDGQLATHIIMASVHLNQEAELELIRPTDLSHLEEVREFKRKNCAVRVIVSILHNHEDAAGFLKASSSPEQRNHFARVTIDFLNKYNLDGIDIRLTSNYTPAFIHREQELIALSKLIKSIKSTFVENFFSRQVSEQHRLQTYQAQSSAFINGSSQVVEPYLLTLTLTAHDSLLRCGSELRQVANLCDWLNIMSYDYFVFKPYAPFTGPNCPLHPIVDPYVPFLGKLSLSWTLARLVEEQIPREKIVMGIPTFGRAYRLMFRNNQPTAFSLALGVKRGKLDDYLDYRELLDILAKPDTVNLFDERARVPYLLTDDGYTWVSYENPQSVREKVNYILQNKLAGYMTCNLNLDDHLAEVGSFPLHRAMADEAKSFASCLNQEHSPNGTNIH